MQVTRIRTLVQEGASCRGATKPVRHNYWACALEPTSDNYWAHVPQLLSLFSRAHERQLLSPRATTTEARAPRARAPQQEKSLQWEARAPQQRVAPTRHNWRKPVRSKKDPTQPKIKKERNRKWPQNCPSVLFATNFQRVVTTMISVTIVFCFCILYKWNQTVCTLWCPASFFLFQSFLIVVKYTWNLPF